MANPTVRQYDIGTNINLTIQNQDGGAVDLTNSVSSLITFLKPDKTIFVRSCDVIAPATNGLVRYVISSGDLDMVGIYSVQAHITTTSGEWYSNAIEIRCERNL